MVYLDYAANSITDRDVLDVFYDSTLKYYANPNSNNRLGNSTRMELDKATFNIAKMLNVLPEEIIYTSGATESNNLAIKGICERYKSFGKHIIVSTLEHNSVIDSAADMINSGFEVDISPVNKDGLVDIEQLKNMIRDDTILISITSVDSELGIRQNIEKISELLKDYPNIYFHTDSSQSFGKVNIDYKNVDLKKIMSGGKSTTIYRSGTPDIAGVLALEKAIEISLNNLDVRLEYVTKLNEEVNNFLANYDNVIINSNCYSIPHIINFSIKGVKSNEFCDKLGDYEVYISTKTSCCPIEIPSKLVYAMTKDKALASTSLRLSLSHLTTEEDIEEFKIVFDKCYKELNI